MEKVKRKIDEDLILFIMESRDLLEEMEPALIGLGEMLEKNVIPDQETVNLIFRGFHTIKGTAAFYQLDGVVSIAHKSETLLEYFRNEKETINATSTDILCHACDAIELLFQQLEKQGVEDLEDDHVRSVIHRLNGRIDLLKKKYKETGNDVHLKTSGPSFESSAAEMAKGKPASPGHGQIGQHIRIFISECRQMLKELDLIHSNQEWSKLLSADLPEMFQVMYEGAVFLGFDHLGAVIHRSLALFKRIIKENRLPDNRELEDVKKDYRDLFHAIDHIEETGVDRFTEDPPPDIDTGFPIDAGDASGPEKSPQPLPDGAPSVSHLMDLFYLEASECINRLQIHLGNLAREPMKQELLEDIKHEFHQIKGGAGIANQENLEWLSGKAGECIDTVMENRITLDAWDIRALLHVVSEMKGALSRNGKEHGRIRFKKAALAHIMDQITSGKPLETKRREIQLPDLDTPDVHDEPETNSSDDDANSELAVTLPLPQGMDESDEKPLDGSRGTDSGLLWGGEKRKAERRDIRVSIEKLDELINLVGELVIAENMVVKNPDVQDLGLINFEKAGVHLRKIVRDLQDVALAVRMVPISGMFRKMIRLVHDLSLKSGKKISLKIIGEDTEIDKTVAELISDPLVHLVRNAIDHGIEKKANTAGAGYDGQIVLEARHEGGEVLVIVRDNGKGLDREKIIAKARAEGIIQGETEDLSDEDIQNLIFHPGFSTQDTVTDLSGRGVGMDVVKKNMEKVKGRIHVFSRPQKGTTFVLRIPLTLAIIDGMLIKVGESSYTIPLLSIRETVQVTENQITLTMDGKEMVNLRGILIPVIRIHGIYHLEPKSRDLSRGLIVVVEHHGEMAGLFIDSIIGEQQTVIKGLSGYMNEIHGISGCTILGDGEVSLILDVAGLIGLAKRHEGPELRAVLRN